MKSSFGRETKRWSFNSTNSNSVGAGSIAIEINILIPNRERPASGTNDVNGPFTSEIGKFFIKIIEYPE
jgi:hypothetical protein